MSSGIVCGRGVLDALHRLAMLGMQSQRYASDIEFRDAVDEALAIVEDAREVPR